MERWFYLIGPDGVPACHELAADQAMPEGAIAIARAPMRGEVVDSATGEIVVDAGLLADFGQSEAIARAHLMKELEAAVILSGVTLDHGYLAEEAEATGVSLIALAEAVNRNSRHKRRQEVARRSMKQRGK